MGVTGRWFVRPPERSEGGRGRGEAPKEPRGGPCPPCFCLCSLGGLCRAFSLYALMHGSTTGSLTTGSLTTGIYMKALVFQRRFIQKALVFQRRFIQKALVFQRE
jgi:hypothetical protein